MTKRANKKRSNARKFIEWVTQGIEDVEQYMFTIQRIIEHGRVIRDLIIKSKTCVQSSDAKSQTNYIKGGKSVEECNSWDARD